MTAMTTFITILHDVSGLRDMYILRPVLNCINVLESSDM
jgi:hypothetical protein